MAQPGRTRSLPRDARRIPVPAAALEQWLAEIDDPGELKVTLRLVAMLAAEPARGATPPSLSLDDLLDDGALRRATELGSDDTIRKALAAALSRETLLAARVGGDVRLLSNDERAREYLAETGSAPLTPAEIAGAGAVRPTAPEVQRPVPATPPRANIFALYERHIGTFGHGRWHWKFAGIAAAERAAAASRRTCSVLVGPLVSRMPMRLPAPTRRSAMSTPWSSWTGSSTAATRFRTIGTKPSRSCGS